MTSFDLDHYSPADARADDFIDKVWRHAIDLMARPDWDCDHSLTDDELFDLASADLAEERGWQSTLQSMRGRV